MQPPAGLAQRGEERQLSWSLLQSCEGSRGGGLKPAKGGSQRLGGMGGWKVGGWKGVGSGLAWGLAWGLEGEKEGWQGVGRRHWAGSGAGPTTILPRGFDGGPLVST